MPPYGFAPSPWMMAVLLAAGLVGALDCATAVAIVGRRFRYGGPPRPAEWVVLLIAARLIVERLPNLDGLVNSAAIALGLDLRDPALFSQLRWAWAAAGLAVALLAAALALGPRRRNAGFRTLGLTAAATAFFWGPAAVCKLEVPWLIWHRTLTPTTAISAGFTAWLETRQAIGGLPGQLLWLVAAAAVVRHHFRRVPPHPPYRWTERIGLASGVLLGAGYLFVTFSELSLPGRFPVAGWLAAVTACAWFLSGRLASAWGPVWTPVPGGTGQAAGRDEALLSSTEPGPGPQP